MKVVYVGPYKFTSGYGYSFTKDGPAVEIDESLKHKFADPATFRLVEDDVQAKVETNGGDNESYAQDKGLKASRGLGNRGIGKRG